MRISRRSVRIFHPKVRAPAVFLLLIYIIGAPAKNAFSEPAKIALAERTIVQWVDILNRQKPPIEILTNNAALDLLDVAKNQSVENVVKNRQAAFAPGRHQILKITTEPMTADFSRIRVMLILGWQDGGQIAQMEQIIELVYQEKSRQFLIHSVVEKYLPPSAGLATKLIC